MYNTESLCMASDILLACTSLQETILTIEYIPVVLPPEPQQPRAHDEWVSAVSGFNSKYIITGSYDNLGR